MFSASIRCPRCKCAACYPLHRKGIDWVISWTGLRPARCMTCFRRFYARYQVKDGRLLYGSRAREAVAVAKPPSVAQKSDTDKDAERSGKDFTRAA